MLRTVLPVTLSARGSQGNTPAQATQHLLLQRMPITTAHGCTHVYLQRSTPSNGVPEAVLPIHVHTLAHKWAAGRMLYRPLHRILLHTFPPMPCIHAPCIHACHMLISRGMAVRKALSCCLLVEDAEASHCSSARPACRTQDRPHQLLEW